MGSRGATRRLLQQWLERKRQKYGTARAALAACPGGEVPLLLEHIDMPDALASAFDHSSGFSPEFVKASLQAAPGRSTADRRPSTRLIAADLSSGNARSLRTLFADQPARHRRRGTSVARQGRRLGPERGTQGASPGVGGSSRDCGRDSCRRRTSPANSSIPESCRCMN